MNIKVTIIIVNYNTGHFTKNCIQSIVNESKKLKYQIFVVDNHSSDQSVEIIKTNYPQVVLIENQENFGFAHANNQVIKISQSEYYLLLNPDTLVLENALDKLIAFMDKRDDIGICGGKVLNPNGSLQLASRRSIPTPGIAFFRLTGLSKLLPRNKTMSRYNLTFLDPNQTYPVDAVSGSFMLVRKKLLDTIGLLDERFFLYGEDLDLCLRAKNAGFPVYYYSEAKILHFKGESSKTNSRKANKEFYRSMYLFHKKHYAPNYFFLLNWLIYLGITLRGILDVRGFFFKRKIGSKR